MRLVQIILFIVSILTHFVSSSQIVINTNLDPKISAPIDSRTQITTLADTASIEFKYDGMQVFVTQTEKLFVRKSGFWEEIGKDGNGIISALEEGDVTVNAKGNSFVLDSVNTFRVNVIGNAQSAGEFRISNLASTTTVQLKTDELNVFPNPESQVGETAPILKLFEGNQAGANSYIGLKAPEQVNNSVTYTLPEIGNPGDQLHLQGSEMYWGKNDTFIIAIDTAQTDPITHFYNLGSRIKNWNILFTPNTSVGLTSYIVQLPPNHRFHQDIFEMIDNNNAFLLYVNDNLNDTILYNFQYAGDSIWSINYKVNEASFQPLQTGANELAYLTPFGLSRITNTEFTSNTIFLRNGVGLAIDRSFGTGSGENTYTWNLQSGQSFNVTANSATSLDFEPRTNFFKSNGTKTNPTQALSNSAITTRTYRPHNGTAYEIMAEEKVLLRDALNKRVQLEDIFNNQARFLRGFDSISVLNTKFTVWSGLKRNMTIGNNRFQTSTDSLVIQVGTTERIRGVGNKLELNAQEDGLNITNLFSGISTSDRILTKAAEGVRQMRMHSLVRSGTTDANGEISVSLTSFGMTNADYNIFLQSNSGNGMYTFEIASKSTGSFVVKVYENGVAKANTSVSFSWLLFGY